MAENKYYITPTGNEIIIREGKAVEELPLKEPKIINLSGDIKSVSAFLEKRNAGYSSQAVDPNKVTVEVDKSARTIIMRLDPENHYGATVTGSLTASEELKQFKINTDHLYNREGLLKQVRFSRLWFDDKDVHQKIVEQLSKITLKTETEMQAANDRQGNKKGMIEQKLNKPDGWIDKFTLLVPLFKGFDNEKITVEICMDVTASGMQFWLESPQLTESMDAAVDSIFKTELESCKDFVIINK